MNYGYIAIEGNIGSGKTSLSKMLAKRYDAQLVLEEFENNEFLPKFYKDPRRHAFTLEMSFLAERYHQLSSLGSHVSLFNSVRISDYLLSKSLIFAASNLSDDELRLFRKVFDIMFKTVPNPDLLVYLYSDTDRLLKNIRKRGRRYEQSIKREYLSLVQSKYLDFLRKQSSGMRVLILDVSQVDFVKDSFVYENMLSVIEKPRSKGLHHELIKSPLKPL
ncbi:MAG: deoxynucleoside kinase [Flavobacteriales bacterium]|nr:deoxynucleoside kinase [Flavobacteriales bacterium]